MTQLVVFSGLVGLPGASAPPPSPFPFELGVEYRFRWRYGGAPVGTTIFRFERGAGERIGGRRVAWRSWAKLDYSRDGTRLRGEFRTKFDAGWRPILYRRQFASSVAGIAGGEALEARFSRESVQVVTQQGDQQIQEVVSLDGPVYICAAQAMEHWAVFLSRLPRPAPERRRIPALQPELAPDALLPIALERDGEGRAGGARCVVYRFRSTGFEGRLWIDGRGRLRRYVQGKLEITLALP